jgi:hypothetical protein
MITSTLKLLEPTPETSWMLNIRQTVDSAHYWGILSHFITLHQLHMLQPGMRFYVIVVKEDLERCVVCLRYWPCIYPDRRRKTMKYVRVGCFAEKDLEGCVVCLRYWPCIYPDRRRKTMKYARVGCFPATVLMWFSYFAVVPTPICFKCNKFYVSGKIFIYTVLILAVEYGLSSSFLVSVCESSWVIYISVLNLLYSRFDRRTFAWRVNLASELSSSLCWAQLTPHIYKFLW